MGNQVVDISSLRKPVHTSAQVNELIAMSLDDKIAYSLVVIKRWYDHWNGNVFVAFSGGKDSTILLHLVRTIFPDVKGVLSNTGLEYPEIMAFAKSHHNVDVVTPVKKFNKVLEEDGFPITNKKQAGLIGKLQNPTKRNFASRRLALIGYATSKEEWNMASKISKKWLHLAFSDIKVTNSCCDYLKKDPMLAWKQLNPLFKPFVGMMFGEGNTRDLALKVRNCNVFDNKDPSSIPLKFWTDKDVYEYADRFGVEICSVYKDYELDRTGCTFCAYGAEQEDAENNRFTKLKKSHPKQFNYFINKLGMSKALDYAGINYGQDAEHEMPLIPSCNCACCGVGFPVSEIGFITEREWTPSEEKNKTPMAGMNVFCIKCAINLGHPYYINGDKSRSARKYD